MNELWKRIQEEPAVVFALVNALLALAIVFGAPLSEAQTGALLAVVNIVVGFLTRQQVTPVTKVEERVAEQVLAQTAGDASTLTADQLRNLDAQRDLLNADLDEEMRRRGVRP